MHPPRGVNTTDTTVLVPINMIKVANTKIIKAKLYKDIIDEQDSIINLHKIKYNALHKEVETLQYNLDNSNKVNDKKNYSFNVTLSEKGEYGYVITYNIMTGGVTRTSKGSFAFN